jgi:hypothetical protein
MYMCTSGYSEQAFDSTRTCHFHTNISTDNKIDLSTYLLRAHFRLLPVVSFQFPLSSPVRLRLELEVLGAFGLDDNQCKVFKGTVDLLLLLGVVLLSALAIMS